MVRALHAAGLEVILDVVYNHTGEGNHLGPTLSFRGIDNAAYYRLDDEDRALLFRRHRHRQQPQRPQPAHAATDHGQPALLGDRDARRRLPVRPRVRARAPVLRGRPALGVLRHHPPGSGALAREAHRRALGRRRGRLPGRQLPGALGRMERRVPRHGPRLLARRRTGIRDLAYRLTGSSDLYQGDGRHPSASINFVTAHDGFTLSRSRRLQREAQRGQRRGQPRRQRRQPLLELRRRGRHRRPGGRSRCAGASGATSSPRSCSPRAARCCSAATRSAAPSTATTTRTARTTRCRGSTGRTSTPRCSRFVQRIVALRRSEPVLAQTALLLRAGRSRLGSQGHRLVPALGTEVSDAEWFDEGQRSLGMILNGDEIPDRDPRGRRIRGGTLMVLLHAGGDPVDWIIPNGWGARWSVCTDTAETDATPADSRVPPRRRPRDERPLPGGPAALLTLRAYGCAATRRDRRAWLAPSPWTLA